jgi:AcrR family transcriptional regulator
MNKKLIENHRKDILLMAGKVFAEHGYYNARISDIAEELEIGHGTIYRYFRNKQDIFSQLLDFIISGISEIVEHEDSSTATTIHEYYQQIERIGWEIFQFFAENRELANIIFYFEAISISKKDKNTNKKIEEFSGLLERYSANYLKNGVKKGFLRKDISLKETARAINAMIFEAIRRIFTSNEKEWKKSAQVWIKTIQGLMTRGMSV